MPPTALHGEEGPLQVEPAHHDFEALVDCAQHIFFRYKGVLKDQFAGRRAAHTQFLQLARNMEAGRFCLKDEGGNAPTPRLRAGFGVKHQQVGNRAIGDEHFRAVEQVAAIELGGPWSRMPMASEPAFGSVRPNAPIISALASPGRYFRFCAPCHCVECCAQPD